VTQGAIRQEVFKLDDGDVIVTFPANISRRCLEDLKAQFDLFVDKLRWPNDADRQAFLRGLAELAACQAGSCSEVSSASAIVASMDRE
jgi:hypothetical protein